MEFFDALKARHSIRAYAGTPVDEEKLDLENEIARIINAPQAHRPVVMSPIGYAAEELRIRERRSLGNLVHKV